jgi:hypothetical protein
MTAKLPMGCCEPRYCYDTTILGVNSRAPVLFVSVACAAADRVGEDGREIVARRKRTYLVDIDAASIKGRAAFGLPATAQSLAPSGKAQLGRADAESESSLRGHLKAEGSEESGSQSYMPPDEKDDRALKEAIDLLRGTITDPAFPPNSKAAVP